MKYKIEKYAEGKFDVRTNNSGTNFRIGTIVGRNRNYLAETRSFSLGYFNSKTYAADAIFAAFLRSQEFEKNLQESA